MAQREPKNEQTTLDDLLSDAESILSELQDEMQEAFDNTPDGLKGSSVGEAREAAAETLGQLSKPDLPEAYANEGLIYTSHPLKSKASRSDRRDEAVNKIDTVISHLQSKRDEIDEEKGDEAKAQAEELDGVIEELENYKSEAEEVYFPGMRG